MTILDLKDSYLSVPVYKDSQKFLQFLWRNKRYAFQGLFFGLNIAPRIFTKILKSVAAFLRKRGIRVILYLDDFLILGWTYQEARSHTAMAVSLWESLGFTVNLEKSCLILTQIITFLGFVIDSYACSSNSKCTRHFRVVSPSNLASSPSFSILVNQNDPSSTFKQPELRCAYYSGSRLFGRTSLVGVPHQL